MATSTIKRKEILSLTVGANESKDIPINFNEVIIIASQHPYGDTDSGLYLVCGGYTNSSAGITAIKKSNDLTVEKAGNFAVRISATKSAFITVVRGVNKRLSKQCLGAPHECINDKEALNPLDEVRTVRTCEGRNYTGICGEVLGIFSSVRRQKQWSALRWNDIHRHSNRRPLETVIYPVTQRPWTFRTCLRLSKWWDVDATKFQQRCNSFILPLCKITPLKKGVPHEMKSTTPYLK